MNVQNERQNPLAGVISSASDVAGDFVELAELQLALIKVDGRKFLDRTVPSLGVALTSVVILLSCLPIALHGVAAVIESSFGLDHGATLLSIGVAGLAIGSVTLVLSLHRLKTGLASFVDSQDQLSKNIGWLKSVIGRNQ